MELVSKSKNQTWSSSVAEQPDLCWTWSKVCTQSHHQKNLSSGFPTRSNTNRAVQPQKMTRGLKFWICEVEALYYLCGENKGTDQLHGY